jgi:hypothetical protein
MPNFFCLFPGAAAEGVNRVFVAVWLWNVVLKAIAALTTGGHDGRDRECGILGLEVVFLFFGVGVGLLDALRFLVCL